MAKWTSRDKTIAKLGALSPAVRTAAADATLKGARRLVALQRARAPVDTGALKTSIDLFVGGAPGTQRAKADPQLTIDIVAGRGKGSPSEHARLIEFGTSDTVPQPYFYPSYRQLKKSIKAAMRRAMKQAIVQVAAK